MKSLFCSLLLTLSYTGCTRPTSTDRDQPVRAPSPTATLEPLRPGVWVHTSYRDTDGFGRVLSNGLVVASGSGALVINTARDQNPDSPTPLLLQAAVAATGKIKRQPVSDMDL